MGLYKYFIRGDRYESNKFKCLRDDLRKLSKIRGTGFKRIEWRSLGGCKLG